MPRPLTHRAAPRGTQSVPKKYRQALAMKVDQGKSLAEIALFFGTNTRRISEWCQRAEAAIADERNMRSLKAVGAR